MPIGVVPCEIFPMDTGMSTGGALSFFVVVVLFYKTGSYCVDQSGS